LKVQGNFDFVLQDEGNIILENCWGVCPALWKYSEAEGFKGHLKGCQVMRALCESMVVVPDE